MKQLNDEIVKEFETQQASRRPKDSTLFYNLGMAARRSSSKEELLTNITRALSNLYSSFNSARFELFARGIFL